MSPVYVDTYDAVTYCMRKGVTREQVRTTLYNWCRQGKVTNYGGKAKHQARWDLREIEQVLRSEVDNA